MLVSVVIPTYNRSKLLKETIRSVLDQTRPADEIIVSDDCSPDDTGDVVRGLTSLHPQIRYIRQSVNLRGVGNWSAVIEASKGDIVAFCTDDDLFLPDHLERSVRYLEEHPEVDMVHAWFKTLATQPDGTVKTLEHPTPRGLSVEGGQAVFYMIRRFAWPFHAATLVFRRSFWNRVGAFDPRFELADTGWFLRCLSRGRVDFLAEPHILNRRHLGNWSNSVGAAKMHAEINQMVLEFIDEVCSSRRLGSTRRLALREAWLMNHRFRTARLLVARGRAGASSECVDALQLLVDSIPGGKLLPRDWVSRAGTRLSSGLSRLQVFLPGGRTKYENLGVSSPR